MRQIKFRAWDKEKQQWRFGYKKNGGFSILGEVVMFGQLSDIPISKLDNIIIQQFTGLYDKEGREIYEGDILKGETDDYINGYYSPVDFYAGSFSITLRYDFTYIPLSVLETVWQINGCKGNENTSLWVNEFEVLGNIYENPELIKQEEL